jgi:hypothetical protein
MVVGVVYVPQMKSDEDWIFIRFPSAHLLV